MRAECVQIPHVFQNDLSPPAEHPVSPQTDQHPGQTFSGNADPACDHAFIFRQPHDSPPFRQRRERQKIGHEPLTR